MKAQKQNKVLIIFLVIVALVLGAWFLYSENSKDDTESDKDENNQSEVQDEELSGDDDYVSTAGDNGSMDNQEEQGGDSNSVEEANFQQLNMRVYRKYGDVVYLLLSDGDLSSDLIYYRSLEVDKFKDFAETGDVVVSFREEKDLSPAVEIYTGVKDNKVQVKKEILSIQSVKLRE